MAFASSSVYFDCGDGSILGIFEEREVGNYFEFSENNTGLFPEQPHLIWVCDPWTMDQGYRFGTVKKTVAYLMVEEDEFGKPVFEKWELKKCREYKREEG
ncbi:MAG: hypothetical protein ACO23H_20215 [Alphaproteobacteria bacterium]